MYIMQVWTRNFAHSRSNVHQPLLSLPRLINLLEEPGYWAKGAIPSVPPASPLGDVTAPKICGIEILKGDPWELPFLLCYSLKVQFLLCLWHLFGGMIAPKISGIPSYCQNAPSFFVLAVERHCLYMP